MTPPTNDSAGAPTDIERQSALKFDHARLNGMFMETVCIVPGGGEHLKQSVATTRTYGWSPALSSDDAAKLSSMAVVRESGIDWISVSTKQCDQIAAVESAADAGLGVVLRVSPKGDGGSLEAWEGVIGKGKSIIVVNSADAVATTKQTLEEMDLFGGTDGNAAKSRIVVALCTDTTVAVACQEAGVFNDGLSITLSPKSPLTIDDVATVSRTSRHDGVAALQPGEGETTSGKAIFSTALTTPIIAAATDFFTNPPSDVDSSIIDDARACLRALSLDTAIDLFSAGCLALSIASEQWNGLQQQGQWTSSSSPLIYRYSSCMAALVEVSVGTPDCTADALLRLDSVAILCGLEVGVSALIDALDPIVRAQRRPETIIAPSHFPTTVPQGVNVPPEDKSTQIRRVHCMQLTDLAQLMTNQTPVVITGMTDIWPARTRWTDLSYIDRHYGHRLVPIEVGKHEDGTWRERLTTISDFISTYILPDIRRAEQGQSAERPSIAVGYLAQHPLFKQLTSLASDFEVPPYCELGELRHIHAWFGTGGTVTPLHYDSYDNLLTQVVGFKFVRLYSQKETPRIQAESDRAMTTGTSAQRNTSKLQPESIDDVMKATYPGADEAKYCETVLRPGDMLFMPARYWHHVRSLSPSFSVNFWF